MFVLLLWNAKHFPMFVQNKYLVQFGYTDIVISVGPLHYQPRLLANLRSLHFDQKCIGAISR